MVFLIPIWKRAPFIRLTIPFICGIIIRHYSENPVFIGVALLIIAMAGITAFSFLPVEKKYLNYHIRGVLINVLMLASGMVIAAARDPFANARLVENFKEDGAVISATIIEPLTEKPATWRAMARMTSIRNGDRLLFPHVKMILYFRKDSTASPPGYGSTVVFVKAPRPIKNKDPASRFDYAKYCAFRNIHYQVFLKADEFIVTSIAKPDGYDNLIFSIRSCVISVIKENIPGKKEVGLALALLIGYKDELHRDLVESYSNTGVVHVIAISGLHLGLIYALLKFLCSPLAAKSGGRYLSALLVMGGLWLFTFLAGASPSVLRSAVMFSAIVIGDCAGRKAPLINNLAASAFFLLCVDPYWLWDLGFILSYTALMGIAIFNRPLYHLLPVKNRLLDAVWKLNAVTLSAQILTMPVIIYQFGQFPNLFLLTNFIAVPVSSLILAGEILLCCVFAFPDVARGVGTLLSGMIRFMNNAIVFFDRFSFSSTRGLDISFLQMTLLYVFIACMSAWLLLHEKKGLFASLVTVSFFFAAAAF